MNRVFTLLRRSLSTKMNAFVKRQDQAERTINLLKQQIAALITIAEQKQRIAEQDEIQKLQKENKEVEGAVKQLKSELRFYESQNGVKQVSLPAKSAPVQTTLTSPQVAVEDKKVESESQQPPNKKEKKKANKENKGPKATKPAGEPAAPIDVSRLKLKIGKIIDAKVHPDADGLFIETVEFGEERPRTILSGLTKHYTEDQMKDRTAIFLCNLKPAKMRGIVSEGMIMCASTPEKVEIITPPEGSVIGDRVACPEFKGEPDSQLNPKKKIWEQVAPELKIDANGFATYKGHPLTIEGKGKCKAPSMTNCPIK